MLSGDTLGVTRAVTTYQDRKEAGRCTRGSCPHVAIDGLQLCAAHRDAENRRAAEGMARIRTARKADHRCSFCGGTLAAPDVPKRKAKTATCRACRIRRDRAKTIGVTPVVTSRSARVEARLIPWENSPANAGRRNRLRGGKRGQPPMAEVDRFDVRLALSELAAAQDLLIESAAIEDKRERAAKHASALDKIGLASRACDEVLIRRRRPVD